MPHSTPTTGIHDERVRARFVIKVRVDGEPHPELRTPCWRWTATRNSNGYGMFTLRSGCGRGAHRIAYEIWVGAIPEGLEIDHRCRQRDCVRPDHLRPLTREQNAALSDNPSALNARKTHCPQGHEYTPENTRVYRGYRYCKECQKGQAARRAEKEGRTLGIPNGERTHCPAGHPYDEENTIPNKGGRRCRTCHRENERARRTKRVLAAEKRERMSA